MNEDLLLRYPVGKFEAQDYADSPFNEALRDQLLAEIKVLPSSLEMALLNLDADQLQTPYRSGGWTVNQVVHHVADSHINAYTRSKLALTENNPTIVPYDQDKWASLPDCNLPFNISLTLLHSLHARWYCLLKSLDDVQWEKSFYHPELKINFSLWDVLKLYEWHGKHHVAHITQLRKKNNW